eukprot:4358230-Prorocentrum_lima.AAC.1
MLNEALQCIYAEEQSALMHLSEARTFNAIDLKTRHYERQTLCVDRTKSLDKINTEFQACLLYTSDAADDSSV